MLLLRDYLFDGLATATGGVTTPLPKHHLSRESFTATGSVTTSRDIFYGYWQCYYA